MTASDNLSPQQFSVEHYSIPRNRFEESSVITTKVDATLSHKRMRDPFYRGHCHALALAIHKDSGHPIGAVYSNNRNYPTHFFNYDKDNPKMGFDATGYRPVKDIVGVGSNYDWETKGHVITPNRHEKVTPEFVVKETSKEGWLPGHHEAAQAIAPTILKSRRPPRKMKA
jgi:hypothetical protein